MKEQLCSINFHILLFGKSITKKSVPPHGGYKDKIEPITVKVKKRKKYLKRVLNI